MFKTLSIAVWAVLFFGSSAVAQTDFFWSFHELNSGATNSDEVGAFNVGDTGTIFLYYSTINSELDGGAGLDLAFSNNSVIEFTSAETIDFSIEVLGTPFDNRWLFPDGTGLAGEAFDVTPNAVEDLVAFSVAGAGQGILNSNTGSGPFLDTGYDADADAFLFAQVEFVAVGAGQTEIITEVGDFGIVNSGQALNPTFGNVSISVVPEPNCISVVAVGILGLFIRRRRQPVGLTTI